VNGSGFPTHIPFLTFVFSLKRDKKGNMVDGEYSDFDIIFVERY